MKSVNLVPSPHILAVLGEIQTESWQCLAELIDNSIDDFIKFTDNPEANRSYINITVEEEGEDTWLIVKDNGFGMDESQLELSLKAGFSSKERQGSLGLFGVGFNIATARLGNLTEVLTSKKGENIYRKVTIDLEDLQRRKSFDAPMDEVKKTDQNFSGTIVRTKLNREMRAEFSRKNKISTLRERLGTIYSYMLREEVPGLSNPELSKKLNMEIRFCGELVLPKLPCIWSDQRKTMYSGVEVPAVIYVDKKLQDAWYCQNCQIWIYVNDPQTCTTCQSTKIIVRERRIFGWVGVQRYLDTSDFGFDLLRNGRKIRVSDREFFNFTDPDTARNDHEYPIEMPANRGRLVGEIHMDHVPVNFMKTDFDRQSRDWRVTVETIRGSSPMKKRQSPEENNSPLARLFSAFRRNDPGLKCLIPGNGEKATHEASRNWGFKFHSGEPEFLTDNLWYKSAASHDGVEDCSEKSKEIDVEKILPPLDPDPKPDPKDKPTTEGKTGTPKIETLDDKKHRLKAAGRKRHELSGKISLPSLGNWEVEIWITSEPIEDDNGTILPVLCFPEKGKALITIASVKHSVISEFGRQPSEMALFETAGTILQLSGVKSVKLGQAYAELILNFDEEKLSLGRFQDKIEELRIRLNLRIFETARDDYEQFWKALAVENQTKCQVIAASSNPKAVWKDVIKTREVCTYFTLSCYLDLIEKIPHRLFDGAVFLPSWSGFPDDKARSRVVDPIKSALEFLSEFIEKKRNPTSYEMQQVDLYLNMVSENIFVENSE